MIIFNDFDKELSQFLLRWVIQSKDIQRKHLYKSGDMVLYYDGMFSNIHEIGLEENEDLTNEVLCNTENYNENREWDLLTGIYIWLPKDNNVFSKIIEEVKSDGG